VLSIRPEARAKLYEILAHNPANASIHRPYYIPDGAFDTMFAGTGVSKDTLDLVRRLLYPQGRSMCFSDLGVVIGRIPDEKTKLAFVKALTRQTAVIARLRIRNNTDIDKLLGYWTSGSGARAKDVRPLLEALKRLHEGGSIGIGYLLPPFARERLYTTPVPTKAGDFAEDCHWSTMNFFNDPPDNRFTNTAYTASFIQSNFYQVGVANLYVDVVLVLNDKGNAIHSAIYIADDIVFTKNGNNFSQPWMLMRLGDLLARYTGDAPPKVLVYRNRNL